MTVTDPVCGMKLEAEDAVATAEHAGDTYYFCSQECKTEFEESPEDYV